MAEQATDIEEIAFQSAQDKWEGKPKRDRRILSIRRHFFHSGYDGGRNSESQAIAAQQEIIKILMTALDNLLSCRWVADTASTRVIEAQTALEEARKAHNEKV